MAVTLNPTEPLAVPLAPDVTEIHAALLVAAHGQPFAVETPIGVPVPAAAGRDWFVGVMRYVHEPDVSAACEMAIARPATVTIPVRSGPVLGATLKTIDPVPVPLAPALMVIQGETVTAVQAQFAFVETVIAVPTPPAAEMD